eukprot:scaffold298_cov247-Pinguiococcus_pyrenoidosus.AAC.9
MLNGFEGVSRQLEHLNFPHRDRRMTYLELRAGSICSIDPARKPREFPALSSAVSSSSSEDSAGVRCVSRCGRARHEALARWVGFRKWRVSNDPYAAPPPGKRNARPMGRHPPNRCALSWDLFPCEACRGGLSEVCAPSIGTVWAALREGRGDRLGARTSGRLREAVDRPCTPVEGPG